MSFLLDQCAFIRIQKATEEFSSLTPSPAHPLFLTSGSVLYCEGLHTQAGMCVSFHPPHALTDIPVHKFSALALIPPQPPLGHSSLPTNHIHLVTVLFNSQLFLLK